MAIIEYKPGTSFPGIIARTVDQSSPAWPRSLRARQGAANVLFIVLDDLGFGQLGCYGAPITAEGLTAPDAKGWERYPVAEDFAENHNLAEQHRDRLIEMISLWTIEV